MNNEHCGKHTVGKARVNSGFYLQIPFQRAISNVSSVNIETVQLILFQDMYSH